MFKVIYNYSDALFHVISNIKSLAIQIKNNNNNNPLESKIIDEIGKICKYISEECNYRLDLYKKYKSPYNLIRINSATFVVKLNIILKEVDNYEINHLYESIQRLHVYRNICSRIINRH